MRRLEDIDYTPLAKMHEGGRMVKLAAFNYVGLAVISFVVLKSFLQFNFMIVYLAAIVISIVLGWSAQKVMSRRNAIWSAFAEANGWYVIKDARQQLFVPPGVASQGSDRRLSDVVHATFENHECDIYTYEFRQTKGRRERHYFTIVRVLLERPFPHIILDSKHTFALVERGSANTRAKLEGNFDQHFSLYHRTDEHINALSIITPDVMQTLIASNQAQDIEIIDNYLFFISSSDQRSAATLPALLHSVDALADEIAHKANTLQYTPEIAAHNAELLTQAIGAYFKSGDKVLTNLYLVLLGMFMLPVVFALLYALSISFMQ